MSGTSSDITIECEPINVSGEIEIEKVNKLSINPFLNRKVSNDDEEKKSMVLGLIFLTISLPLLIIIINKMFIWFKSGDLGNKYWFGGYCVVFVSFFVPAILGLTKNL